MNLSKTAGFHFVHSVKMHKKAQGTTLSCASLKRHCPLEKILIHEKSFV